MAYNINDNNFSRDDYTKRRVRLEYLAMNVSKYAAELSISGDMLSWATNAHSIFSENFTNNGFINREKDKAFSVFQRAFDTLSKRYQILKNLLKSRYADDESKLLIFGISGQTPRSIAEIIRISEMLTVANLKLKESGDANVLPDSMISEFQGLIDDAKEKYLLAGMKREEATKDNKNLRELFDADSKRLKSIYSWILTFWKNDDDRMIELGFDKVKPRRGRQGPLAPTNLTYDIAENLLKWDESENATSYQVAIADAESIKIRWQKYYSGDKTEVVLNSKFQKTKVKIRARSANGFGKWGEVFEY